MLAVFVVIVAKLAAMLDDMLEIMAEVTPLFPVPLPVFATN
jgi:hypothetical protein